MPRHLFPGDLHLLPDGTPAANTSFTLWTDSVSGAQITDVLASDSVSAVALTTSADGLRPYIYGPNDVEVIYVDTGASIRFPVYADDVLKSTLDETFLAGLSNRVTALETGVSAPTGITLATMPAGYTHSITLAAAKAAGSRAAVTSRSDVVIRVYGGTATSEWATPWLLDGVDYWDLVSPVGNGVSLDDGQLP